MLLSGSGVVMGMCWTEIAKQSSDQIGKRLKFCMGLTWVIFDCLVTGENSGRIDLVIR